MEYKETASPNATVSAGHADDLTVDSRLMAYTKLFEALLNWGEIDEWKVAEVRRLASHLADSLCE